LLDDLVHAVVQVDQPIVFDLGGVELLSREMDADSGGALPTGLNDVGTVIVVLIPPQEHDYRYPVTADEPLTLTAEFADLVAEALDEVSDPLVLDELVVHLAAAEPPGTGAGLVAAWGERLARYLVQGMALDEPPVNRRFLVEFLAWVGRDDVRLLAALVADPRWFVVRNVAIALGRTGRPQAVPPLESVLDHPDHRVRIEALRGLFALKQGEAVAPLVAALADPEPRVRHAAVSLLRASPSREVVGALVDLLETHPPAAAEARRLVDVIAERSDTGVPAALERLAGRRRAMGAARVVRDAARQVLEGARR
jgi:HEAT repeat protein